MEQLTTPVPSFRFSVVRTDVLGSVRAGYHLKFVTNHLKNEIFDRPILANFSYDLKCSLNKFSRAKCPKSERCDKLGQETLISLFVFFFLFLGKSNDILYASVHYLYWFPWEDRLSSWCTNFEQVWKEFSILYWKTSMEEVIFCSRLSKIIYFMYLWIMWS